MMEIPVHNSTPLLLILWLLLFGNSALGLEKVLYGDDNRVEPFNSPDPMLQQLALGTAAKISNRSLKVSGDDLTIGGSNLIDRFGICPDERFTNQLVAAACSGFLVAPDILVTAGHCMHNDDFDCKKFSWVFDFALKPGMESITRVHKSKVYRCTEILAKDYDPYNEYFENDYAVIRLDRPVVDRTPLKVRLKGEIELGTPLAIIGHPSGLPTKIADGAFVRDNPDVLYFTATLDSFGGNSGSAVFNAQSGEVEGILVLGETDYVTDEERGCSIPKRCAEDECVGERVIRTTMIPYLRNL
jgi:V8-like Glu-specific endopeptidase